MEILFELIGELLLQIIVEVLGELGLQALAAPFRREPNPWLAALGYALFGLILGGISLPLLPQLLVGARFRLLNLIVSPVACGGLMAFVGTWRRRRGDTVLRIDRFGCGFLFALGFAIMRFGFAR